MNNTKYYWLRWIGVLPASIIAYLIAYNVLRLLSILSSLFEGRSQDGWYNLYIVPVVASAVAGYVFVSWGVFMAPIHKKHTGIGLLILMTLLIGGAIFIELTQTRVRGIVELIASLVGTIVGYFSIEED